MTRELNGHTRIAPPLDNGCADCAALDGVRAFCARHRSGKPCLWCSGRGFRVRDNRWVRCNGGMS